MSVATRRCSLVRWFHSCLTGRTQSFVLGDTTTDAYTVDCSVPQGSVLGPLSFIAYTDDISDVIERQHGVSLHQYAVDKQLFASAKQRCPWIALDWIYKNGPMDISGAKLDHIADLRRQLGNCVMNVRRWCASRRQNGSDLVRVPCFHRQVVVARPNTDHRRNDDQHNRRCTQPRRSSRLPIVDEATRCQGCVRLFLPYSPFAPDPSTCPTGSDDPPCTCHGHNPHRLLQLAVGGPTAIDVGTTAESTELCSASYS